MEQWKSEKQILSELKEENKKLKKQIDELIKFIVDTMTAMPINSTIYKKADELLTKTKHNE